MHYQVPKEDMELHLKGDSKKVLVSTGSSPIVLEENLKDRFLTLWTMVDVLLQQLSTGDPRLKSVTRIATLHCRGPKMQHIPPIGDVLEYMAGQIDFLDIRLLDKVG